MKEVVLKLRSRLLQNERTIRIREPAEAGRPINLAIFLDGEFYSDRIGANSVISRLEEAAGIGPALFVFVSRESVEARWRECPCNPAFAAFIAEELLPWIESRYEGAKRPPERVLAGLSYTGPAAAHAAISAPGIFTKVISQFGSFWWNDCWLAESVRAGGGQPSTDHYLDVGPRETDQNIQHRPGVLLAVSQIDGVRRFRDAPADRGHRVKYLEFDGGHDFAAWGVTLPDALAWALAASPENSA